MRRLNKTSVRTIYWKRTGNLMGGQVIIGDEKVLTVSRSLYNFHVDSENFMRTNLGSNLLRGLRRSK